jgi:hypothetical protein
MKALIKNLIFTHAPMKVLSVILGYSLWSFLAQHCLITQSITVPVCFYNTTSGHIQANTPTITIAITGTRSNMRLCTETGCHINATSLSEGEHMIMPHEKNLFLPKSVKLVHCEPRVIKVTVTHQNILDSAC